MPRRVMEGRVVSDKTHKTVTVLVERRIMDPLYKKFIRRSKKYAAHDEANAFRTGDFVAIEECPPISKSKRWKVISAPPAVAREDKPVAQALAARAAADLAKPEPKARVKKGAEPKVAVKAVKPVPEVKPAKAKAEAKSETPAKPAAKVTKPSKPTAAKSAKAEKPATETKPADAPKAKSPAKKKKDDQ
jgi:small subunit ribosomal protein S17